jgi:hypothetical protein
MHVHGTRSSGERRLSQGQKDQNLNQRDQREHTQIMALLAGSYEKFIRGFSLKTLIPLFSYPSHTAPKTVFFPFLNYFCYLCLIVLNMRTSVK